MMNRRTFIRTTGFSIGALIIRPAIKVLSNSSVNQDVISFPDEVTVISDKGSFTLTSSDKSLWKANDMMVKLSETRNAVAVDVQSPVEKLKSVVLKWKTQKAASVRCLGDHWERSYGDLRWQILDEERIMPWYFMEYDGRVTNGFGVRTGCRSMCFWQVGAESVRLTLDIRSGGNGVRLGDRALRAAEIVVQKGMEGDSPFVSTRKFCQAMCESPRLPKKPVYGINDWYFAYGNNSDDLIIQHTSLMAESAAGNSNRPFSVIDAGWAKLSPKRLGDICWGDDFTACNSKFTDMAKLADTIKTLGMRPGIWVRPLSASVNDNQSRLLPGIPGRNNLTAPFLDPTIPENIEKIKNIFVVCKTWGYELIKHDFTTFDLLGKWGFQMFESRDITSGDWRFYDDTLTNAEIILNLYSAIREASGETYLLGCNTVSHLSAGLFELQRIGDDTSGQEWERTRKMGVNTLGFRMPHHGMFYAADGDCVGLTTKVPWEKNKQWMQLVAESGTPLFISAQKEAVGEAQKAFITQCFKTASQLTPPGEPLDWLENQFPSRWRLMGKVVEFDWS